jgi:hypothetical protein
MVFRDHNRQVMFNVRLLCSFISGDLLIYIFFIFQKDRIDRSKKLTKDLQEMFQNHEQHKRIIFDDIFFINGKDKNDPEIDRLKTRLVEVAFRQKSWGKRMPMAWVPLDLQLSEMRSDNTTLISKEDLTALNRSNEDLALTDNDLPVVVPEYHLNMAPSKNHAK